MIICELDLLRDEGVAYAEKLRASDVLLELKEFEGVDDAYNLLTEHADMTRGMYDLIAGHIAKLGS